MGVLHSWKSWFNLGWWMGFQRRLRWISKDATVADARLLEFRELQLKHGSLGYSDVVRFLHILFDAGGPAWRIERHVLKLPFELVLENPFPHASGGNEPDGAWEQA